VKLEKTGMSSRRRLANKEIMPVLFDETKYSVEILGVAIGYKIVWPASINLVELSQSKTLERAKPGTKWSRDQKKKNSREN